jgi:hypothetical protein
MLFLRIADDSGKAKEPRPKYPNDKSQVALDF